MGHVLVNPTGHSTLAKYGGHTDIMGVRTETEAGTDLTHRARRCAACSQHRHGSRLKQHRAHCSHACSDCSDPHCCSAHPHCSCSSKSVSHPTHSCPPNTSPTPISKGDCDCSRPHSYSGSKSVCSRNSSCGLATHFPAQPTPSRYCFAAAADGGDADADAVGDAAADDDERLKV